ncbi:beta-galactosidase [Roseateles depolymerans]|uniref:Beta-galactosidase n=1 Tax=Roseateles depolymerans TaxID=76731 RepID=A0A0U3MS39_9BURK|nr:beta-galactosidase [Roseateles depolymerans]ALV07146.1 beta-galactosidase [Roseateles depolymerans]REG20129.1 beta-galactosidase [Roseateles depolymerans]
MRLGVCYYPEQWPRERWADDARAMREMGLSTVRIAEFAWSRMEPSEGRFDWEWLDAAIDTLAAQGLQVILGTPTAAPPQWLVQAHPDVLPVDAQGRVKPFGARRHYCFSSPSMWAASERIVTAMAERYGQHPAVVAWQTDNEYGCHDTTLSYSPAALAAFRHWLAQRYGTIEALNEAWGTAFWGVQFLGFEHVGFPVGQPTSALPTHAMDFRRFSSDQVVRYNRMQVDLLRRHAPGRPVLHNFMGLFGEFDHHDMAADLDIAAWDSYPLGHVDTAATFLTEAERQQWARTGHPDISAFHHDLYRGIGHGRLWVMEQQAGPVNWADWNALPLPGMVRAWSWEAFAHGAELVSYFRWRQLPYGQEQMHSGLNRPDGKRDVGGEEAAQVAREIAQVMAQVMAQVSGDAFDQSSDQNRAQSSTHAGGAALPAKALATDRAEVALVVDYPSLWMTQIQPQGKDMAGFGVAIRYYSALRRLGLNVDVVGPDTDLTGYRLVVLPQALHVSDALAGRLAQHAGVIVAGPRTGSKTADLAIAAPLPPGPLRTLLPVRVRAVESMRPGRRYAVQAESGAALGHATQWRDLLDLDTSPQGQDVQVRERCEDGWPARVSAGRVDLHAALVDEPLLQAWLDDAARRGGLSPVAISAQTPGLRLRRRGAVQFAINHGPADANVPLPTGVPLLLGSATLPPGGVAAWVVPGLAQRSR